MSASRREQANRGGTRPPPGPCNRVPASLRTEGPAATLTVQQAVEQGGGDDGIAEHFALPLFLIG